MTLKELRDQVSYLGFDAAVYDGMALRCAADRALRHIFLDSPSFRTARIPTPAPKPVTLFKSFKHEGGRTERITLRGGAVTFRLSGEGRYRITDGHEVHEKSFSGKSITVKMPLKSGGHLELFGKYDFTVYGLATYRAPLGAGNEGIPEYRSEREYSLRSLIGDFSSAETPPRDVNGDVIHGAAIETDRLTVPFDYDGEVIFTYRRTPSPVADLSEDAEIDCPAQLVHALPLITASYVLLDEDEEKAAHYLSLYKDSVSTVRRSVRSRSDATYATNGWA